MKYIQMKYYNTYYHCNMIMNVINKINYASTINQFFEGYFGEEEDADYYVFQRVTILHEFLEWVISVVILERMRNIVEITQDADVGGYNDFFSMHNQSGLTIIEEIMCRYDEKQMPCALKGVKEIHLNRNCETPIFEKYSLSIEQAADYFGIGQKKLRQIVADHEGADFILYNGNRVQIKRKKFESFLDKTSAI